MQSVITPMASQPLNQAMPLLEYLDTVREQRTVLQDIHKEWMLIHNKQQVVLIKY